MENSTSFEILAAVQVLWRFNQYLNNQAAAQAKSSPATDTATRQGHPSESPVLEEMRTLDNIIAKLLALADQLKQRENVRRSHVQSI